MVEEAAGMEKEAHGMEEDVKENKSDLVMCLKDDCMSIHTRKQHTEHYNKFHRGVEELTRRDLTDEEATFWNQKTLAEQRSYRKRVSSQLQSRQMSTRMSMAANHQSRMRPVKRQLTFLRPRHRSVTYQENETACKIQQAY
ncbi:hypothetical protein H257_16060 [Aphanomyces astaci]|uniref:Uncharacterized protein n=1 Tax=Aphanomyces astaci TaxID=112090 RepID=W4FM92_APHAT|nr:hypothetical protein H257_16060 [Aphanomyces astaci]ETV67823.1 hypothetical protein H257_16060 [Aphanomyces astaci]|eukprot:XP_009842681.1 hypothetical protein H257_16060 [Aphanomyces astaci]